MKIKDQGSARAPTFRMMSVSEDNQFTGDTSNHKAMEGWLKWRSDDGLIIDLSQFLFHKDPMCDISYNSKRQFIIYDIFQKYTVSVGDVFVKVAPIFIRAFLLKISKTPI